jgi:predicted NBD/HSP70 family sugar kinase
MNLLLPRGAWGGGSADQGGEMIQDAVTMLMEGEGRGIWCGNQGCGESVFSLAAQHRREHSRSEQTIASVHKIELRFSLSRSSYVSVHVARVYP